MKTNIKRKDLCESLIRKGVPVEIAEVYKNVSNAYGLIRMFSCGETQFIAGRL